MEIHTHGYTQPAAVQMDMPTQKNNGQPVHYHVLKVGTGKSVGSVPSRKHTHTHTHKLPMISSELGLALATYN